MQIFVKGIDGHSVLLHVQGNESVEHIKQQVEEMTGVPRSEQSLTYAGRLLHDGQALCDYAIQKDSTLYMSLRLCGGKPVKVSMITNHLPCGPEVYIDIETDTPMHEVKRKLQAVTGVPVEHQKVMLAGIGRMVMGDKRTNIKFSHCGSTSNLYFATLETEERKTS